jgi:two-component system, sensor histidine kinase PdtaS
MTCFCKSERYLLTWLLLFAMPVLSNAQVPVQQHTPGKLLALIEQSKPDTSRINLLLELSEYYFDTEWNYRNKIKVDSALGFLVQAKNLSDSIGAFELTQKTLTLMGYYYFRCDNAPQAEKCFMQVIGNYRKAGNKEKEAQAWVNFGIRSPLIDSTLQAIIGRFENALHIYRELNNKIKEASVILQIAYKHVRQGKLNLAEGEAMQALNLQKSNGTDELQYTYDLLAHLSGLKGNYNIAILYELEAIKNMERTGDYRFEDSFYNALGGFYGELGEVEKSIQWLNKSLDVVKSNSAPGTLFYKPGPVAIEERNALYSLVRRIVQGLIKQNKEQEAFAFLMRTTKEYPPDTDFAKQLQAGSMGDCYGAMNQYKTAEEYYRKAITLEISTGQIEELRREYYNISNLYIAWRHYPEAATHLNKLMAMPEGVIGVSMLSDLHKMLFKIDSASGNYLGAIKHYQAHKAINDSIFTEKKSRQIQELQIQYETGQKEKDIQLLQKQASLHQHEIQQALLAKNLTFGGIILLLIIVGLLYYSYRVKQRSNLQLQAQQWEINNKNHSLRNLVDEKEWLLKEVHHRVKNNLATIMSLLNSQSAYLNNAEALNAIRDSQHRVQAMSLIHQKLYQSENVAAIDMAFYIRELVEYLRDSFNTKHRIRFEMNLESVKLDIAHAVPLGLILNEAITNAIKYAFPENKNGVITISMKHETNDHFSLTISDNGVGLPPDFDSEHADSLGMSLMQGLSEDIGARFGIQRDNGTVITIQFVCEHT